MMLVAVMVLVLVMAGSRRWCCFPVWSERGFGCVFLKKSYLFYAIYLYITYI